MTQEIVLSILMLAGLALAGGSIYLLMRRRDMRKQALLMGLAALVMFANVAIWLVPLP